MPPTFPPSPAGLSGIGPRNIAGADLFYVRDGY
jgi:hypothetical protein